MKKIIIIGASDGLGKAIASLCKTEKLEVVNVSRTPCDVSGVVNIACDLSIEKDIDNAVNIIKENHSNFDAIINCAAIVAMEKINEITNVILYHISNLYFFIKNITN